MQRHILLSGLIISAPGILCAQTTEQEAYQELTNTLSREVQLLSSITDEATAKAALPELKELMAKLSALSQEVDNDRLWRHIENTPGLKQPLLEAAEQLLVELQRLEKARCFSVRPLYTQLRPMLIPAS